MASTTETGIAMNVNRFGQSVSKLETVVLRIKNRVMLIT